MDSRFSSPVFPGDELTIRVWDDGDGRAISPKHAPTGAPASASRLPPPPAHGRTIAQRGTDEERVVIDNGLCIYN